MKKIFLCLSLLIVCLAIQAQTVYTVNSSDDNDDGLCDATHCSLREAINEANTDGTASIIEFNISGTAPHTIRPNTSLPLLTASNTTIDATTQMSWSLGDIIIDGSNVQAHGLDIRGLDCAVYGLQIQNFSSGVLSPFYASIFVFTSNVTIGAANKENSVLLSDVGIYFVGQNNLIQYNYCGTDAQFSVGSGNIYHGILGISSGTTSTIQNNYCGNNYAGIRIQNSSNIDILNNYIGTNPTGTVDIGNSFQGIVILNLASATMNSKDILIQGNTLGHNRHAIYLADASSSFPLEEITMSENSLFCNISGLTIGAGINTGIAAPSISSSTSNLVTGTGITTNTIEVFLVDNGACTNANCQGKTFLGSTTVDAMGNWTLIPTSSLTFGQSLTATTTDVNGNTSPYASCFQVTSSDCDLAQAIPILLDPCGVGGVVTDLNLVGTSMPAPSCTNTFISNDTWYSVQIPSSGNCLIRVNEQNEVNPIIEAYSGSCTSLASIDCFELDSLPYAMALSNRPPGETVYLRVWDRDNINVGSSSSNIVHLSSHFLSPNQNDWVICDYNPASTSTVVNEIAIRDADEFIVQYEANATPAEINTIVQDLINEGAVLEASCDCGQVPLQLWTSPNIIEIEDKKKTAVRKAKVDTSNFNYIFEANIEEYPIQINDYVFGQQYVPQVAMDTTGNFVLAWLDFQRQNSYLKLYNNSGSAMTNEIELGPSNLRQLNPDVAMNANGDFVVVWDQYDAVLQTDRTVWGQLYDQTGLPLGMPFSISETASIQSNISNAESGTYPKVAMDDSGNFTCIWQSGAHLYMQQFNVSGTLLNNLVQINASTISPFAPYPDIAMNGTGNFILTWHDGNIVSDSDVYASLFDANGTALISETLVNTTTIDPQVGADVSMNASGNFVITWQSQGQDGDGFGIFAQRYDANGAAVGNEFQANTYTTGRQDVPTVSLFNDDTFIITWSSDVQDGNQEGIYTQQFDNQANPIGTEFRMNETTFGSQFRPETATNKENMLIAAWETGPTQNVMARRYEYSTSNPIVPLGSLPPISLLGIAQDYGNTIYAPTDSVSNVRVAVIDTGVEDLNTYINSAVWVNQEANDTDNCVLGDNIGYDFLNGAGDPTDIEGHGTKVNGVITREFDTDIQLELMNLKFLEADTGKVFTAVCGIYYAIDNGADILNLSWGFEAIEAPEILKDALLYAANNDVLIITTAGNTSRDNDLIDKFPANFDIPNMIVVAAYQIDEIGGTPTLSDYSSYGQMSVDIAAYGLVQTSTVGDSLGVAAGTSLAAPAVSRTAATIRGLYPSLTATDIADCILTTATTYPDFVGKMTTNGILNHEAALECAKTKAMGCLGIDLVLSLPQNTDSLYQTDAWITSTATIAMGTIVDYKAAECIELSSDFEVNLGTEFSATIEDCDPNSIPQNLQGTENNPMFELLEHSNQAGKIKTRFYAQADEMVQIVLRHQNTDQIAFSWTTTVEETAWYEKILDVYSLESAIYNLEFQKEETLTKKNILIQRME